MTDGGSGRADKFSRRALLRTAGIATGSLATAPAFNLLPTFAQEKPSTELPNFTGPGANRSNHPLEEAVVGQEVVEVRCLAEADAVVSEDDEADMRASGA